MNSLVVHGIVVAVFFAVLAIAVPVATYVSRYFYRERCDVVQKRQALAAQLIDEQKENDLW